MVTVPPGAGLSGWPWGAIRLIRVTQALRPAAGGARAGGLADRYGGPSDHDDDGRCGPGASIARAFGGPGC